MSFNLQAQEYSTKSRKAISLFEQARITYSSTEREALLNKAIKKDKKFVEAYWALSQHVMRKNNYTKAIEILSIVNSPKFPYRAQTQYMIAELNFLKGDYTSPKCPMQQLIQQTTPEPTPNSSIFSMTPLTFFTCSIISKEILLVEF